MYSSLLKHLGTDKTEPPGYPNILKYRVVTMSTRATTMNMKEKIISAFTRQRGSVLRIVIATTAFRVGLDCLDVHQILHWGPTSDIEHYVQEIGRAGRDGRTSKAILMYKKASCYTCTTKAMKSYAENRDSCRRKTLYMPFINYTHSTNISKHDCCDNCTILL